MAKVDRVSKSVYTNIVQVTSETQSLLDKARLQRSKPSPDKSCEGECSHYLLLQFFITPISHTLNHTQQRSRYRQHSDVILTISDQTLLILTTWSEHSNSPTSSLTTPPFTRPCMITRRKESALPRSLHPSPSLPPPPLHSSTTPLAHLLTSRERKTPSPVYWERKAGEGQHRLQWPLASTVVHKNPT